VAPVAEVPLELVLLLCELGARRSGLSAFSVAPQWPLANGSARRSHLDDRLLGLRLHGGGGGGVARWQPHAEFLLGRSRRCVAVGVWKSLELGAVVAAAHAQHRALAPRPGRATRDRTQLPWAAPPSIV